jgi:hypothetical protein
LNKIDKDDMCGPPCRPPVDAIVLRQVWTYNGKYEGTLKDRNCCDGSVLKGRGIEYARHYTACISQQGIRIFWAITALRGWVAIGADTVNAFVQSPPPSEPTFVLVDDQMHEWLKQQKRIQVDDGGVHPVLCDLQRHPESGSIWSDKVESYLKNNLHFTSPVHEPYIYVGTYVGQVNLIGRQVDNFKAAGLREDKLRELFQYMATKINIITEYGLVFHYNGIDIVQARDYIKIHVETYTYKFLKVHE